MCRSARAMALSISVVPPESPTRPGRAYASRNSRFDSPMTATISFMKSLTGHRRAGGGRRVRLQAFPRRFLAGVKRVTQAGAQTQTVSGAPQQPSCGSGNCAVKKLAPKITRGPRHEQDRDDFEYLSGGIERGGERQAQRRRGQQRAQPLARLVPQRDPGRRPTRAVKKEGPGKQNIKAHQRRRRDEQTPEQAGGKQNEKR